MQKKKAQKRDLYFDVLGGKRVSSAEKGIFHSRKRKKKEKGRVG